MSEEEHTPEEDEISVSAESGNDRVDVRRFDIVVSPGSSVTVFYSVAAKAPQEGLANVAASFVRTQSGMVMDTIAGASVTHPGQVLTGDLDVLPGAFGLRAGDGAECLLTGMVGGQGFFFKKSIDLTEHTPEEPEDS